MFLAVPAILYFLSTILLILSIIFIAHNNILIIEWELFSIISTTIKTDIILNWERILYSSIVILISANVLKFSKHYISLDPNKLRFTYIVLIFITSINLLIYIPNIICLLIGWDGLGITSFILVIYYNNERSLRARILTILINRLGDAFMLLSIAITLNIGDWTIIRVKTNIKLNNLQLIGILTAAITKRAQIPYSRWLPAAIAAPTPVSALVHSSTLVTAGIFLMHRFFNIIIKSFIAQSILIISGILTTLIASIRAIYENDIKKIIALSTLSQLGLITTCLGVCLPNLTFLHMSTHALFKALLFITAGSLISINHHNQDLRTYGQYFNLSPITASSILISTTALAGIPFMSGYYSKHAIIEWTNIISINLAVYTILLLAVIITAYYSVRLIIFILISPPIQEIIHKHHKSNNNDFPIIIMSVLRTVIGRTLQWATPIITIEPSISENLKSSLLPTSLILTRLLIAPLLSTKTTYKKKHKAINNMFALSLRFSKPLWTEFHINLWITASLNLYKYLDQSWLEKRISIGPSSRITKLSKLLNISLKNFSQQKIFTYITTSRIRLFLFHILLL